jgi:transcriptional regulator with XRE-family HTH domain
MPRRNSPDEIAVAVGGRIRALRHAAGMSIQDLAERSEIHSKGHLSNVERGLVRPNVQTLKQIAEGLGVLPLDLMTFPAEDSRQKLIEATRGLPPRKLAELLRLTRETATRRG